MALLEGFLLLSSLLAWARMVACSRAAQGPAVSRRGKGKAEALGGRGAAPAGSCQGDRTDLGDLMLEVVLSHPLQPALLTPGPSRGCCAVSCAVSRAVSCAVPQPRPGRALLQLSQQPLQLLVCSSQLAAIFQQLLLGLLLKFGFHFCQQLLAPSLLELCLPRWLCSLGKEAISAAQGAC